jgi:hypothetical protein
MSKHFNDKFINLIFKENKKTKFNGTKQLNNLGNYGCESGFRYFVDRNGEYNGIVIEMSEKIYPLYLSNTVHQLYLCVESGYIDIGIYIERFGLAKLYQKYSNELVRFIVDEFLLGNNIEPFYLDYPKIKVEITKDLDLIELKKKIGWDYHELIQVQLKVVSTGSLLPDEWMGKIFNSGKEFHKSIDLLDERIGKPPVTYLANYSMSREILNKPEIINQELLNQYKKISNTNIFVLDSIGLKCIIIYNYVLFYMILYNIYYI